MAFLSSDWEKKSCFNINAHLPSLWILPVHTFAASLWILPVHTFAISVNLTCPHICHLCGSYLSTHLPSLWNLPVHSFAISVDLTCPHICYLCGSYLPIFLPAKSAQTFSQTTKGKHGFMLNKHEILVLEIYADSKEICVNFII